MERPQDDYKRTHNVRLETRDKLFGGLVSRLQVAELVAACVANPELAGNKVSLESCPAAHDGTAIPCSNHTSPRAVPQLVSYQSSGAAD